MKFRSAAPNTFSPQEWFMVNKSQKDALSAAFDLLSKGADGIYFGRIQLVETLLPKGSQSMVILVSYRMKNLVWWG